MWKMIDKFVAPAGLFLGVAMLTLGALLMLSVPAWGEFIDMPGAPLVCAGDICNTTCSGCTVTAGNLCVSPIENGKCLCDAKVKPPQGKSCKPCGCIPVLQNPDDPTSQPECKCR